MQYFGRKLSAAQLQVAGWMGGVRRSLQGALDLVLGTEETKDEDNDKDDKGDEAVEGRGRYQRAISPIHFFTRQSRRGQRRATKTCSAQINTQSNEDKDADALIDHKPKTLHKTSQQTPESNSSPVLVPDQPLEVSSDNADTADTLTEEEFAPFPESTTPLLDTSAQRSKADLGRRRSRVRAPRSVQMPKMEHQDWRACDSTDVNETSVEQKESNSDDEEPKLKIVCSAPSTSQRVSTFPGVNPAALIAQIKKRTGGDRTGEVQATEEVKTQNVKDSPNEEFPPSSSQLSRSPRSASHLAGAALVLPPLGGSSGGPVSSPAWLKELKSKKRMTQNDGES